MRLLGKWNLQENEKEAYVPTEPSKAHHAHYDCPPILEAVLRFNVEPIKRDAASFFAHMGTLLIDSYPKKEEQIQKDGSSNGFAFFSENSKQRIYVNINNFSFVKAAPYDKWETFVSEAKRVWSVFTDAAGDAKVSSFAIRYVNELRIPLGIPLHDFFNIYPALPDRSQLLNNFFMRVDTMIDSPRGSQTTFMRFHGREDDIAKIHLDNTFTFQMNINEDVWESVEGARVVKNKIFESQIKQYLRERL